eukprot:TRINITY_DN1628_c0_g1_i12.p2 TRINITY_DN1628_c0_g1~~TRINITY_DN1628_c0_g1_i12.p2  ORF type:complete len:249 (-),score=70.65 TRINITY_DN1628_c0_g1_i12:1408-2154(-)
MGCGLSTGTYEAIIESKENTLGFKHFQMNDIQQAFFYLNDERDLITQKGVQRAFTVMRLHLNKDDEWLSEQFLSSFEVGAEPPHYNFRRLIIALFMMSGNSNKEKATELFRLFDRSCIGSLDSDAVDLLFCEVFEAVSKYSLLFAELSNAIDDPTKKIAEKGRKVIDELKAKFFKEGVTSLREHEFVDAYVRYHEENEFPLTSTGVRAKIMGFVFKEARPDAKRAAEAQNPLTQTSLIKPEHPPEVTA